MQLNSFLFFFFVFMILFKQTIFLGYKDVCPYFPYWLQVNYHLSFTDGSDGKESAYSVETWLDLWVGKIPWRRKWQPTPIFLPRKSHGWRRLAGHGIRVRHDWATSLSLITIYICLYLCRDGQIIIFILLSQENN